jgi:hypothetical protein
MLVDFKIPQLLGLLALFICFGATASTLLADVRLRVLVVACLLLAGGVVTWRRLLDDRDRTLIARLLPVGAQNG